MKISIFLKGQLRAASLIFFVVSLLAVIAGGVGRPGDHTPATQLYEEAKQPAQKQLILQEARPLFYAVAGTSFLIATIVASVVKLTGTRLPTTTYRRTS